MRRAYIKYLLVGLFIVQASFITGVPQQSAQTGPEVKVMETTCGEIEQKYFISACSDTLATAVTKDAIFHFSFSSGECSRAESAQSRSDNYDIARGTLTSVFILFVGSHRTYFSDFDYRDMEFDTKPDGDHFDHFVFTNLKEGIRFTASKRDGPISSLEIFPSDKFADRRCHEIDAKPNYPE